MPKAPPLPLLFQSEAQILTARQGNLSGTKVLLGVRKTAKYWLGFGLDGFFLCLRAGRRNYSCLAVFIAMLFLPTSCPDCKRLTMEVVEYEPDDSYEARCTACGCLRLESPDKAGQAAGSAKLRLAGIMILRVQTTRL